MNRNISPKRVALILAAVLSAMLTLILGIAKVDAVWVILGVAVMFCITYLLSLYLIQIFIYRKIKLIYKTIHHLKSNKDQGEKNFLSNNDLLEKVKLDVAEWAEDQQKQMTVLREQEKFRKEFLANISHELKTPIFSIQGYLHTLLDGAIEDEKVNLKFVRKAANNADRLQELVEDLLVISKIEKREINLNCSHFDICQRAKEVWERLEQINKIKKIELLIKEGCNKPFFVFADKDEIDKVLENLLSNSIKYGKENGLTVLSFYEMGKNILTEISDDGEGIDEGDLPRLFERFYRAEKSRSREMGGTGLGLSIVKHIIESHNQTINVRSALGIGTTFGFTLSQGK